MSWAVLNYSKAQVDKAGETLIIKADSPALKPGRILEALEILNNWRASHNFPLNTIQMRLRDNAKKVDSKALIAQRLKRVPSILAKLLRFDGMKLSRMQDIGGCRAVLSTVANVEEVRKRFERSKTTHEPGRVDNYIQKPKDDGYRGIHLVYRYRSKNNPEYNGHRIEIQLRSRLMHAWATAVETADTFNRHSLKTGQAPEDWRQFFRCVGSVFAKVERTAPVSGAPTDEDELRREVSGLDLKLNASRLLRAITVVDTISNRPKPSEPYHPHYFLLILEPDVKMLQIAGYPKEAFEVASADYLEREKTMQQKGGQVVLVSVDSMEQLKRAYPNYFGDTRIFLDYLDRFKGNPGSGEPTMITTR